MFIGVVVSSNAVVGALHEAPAQRDRCPPAQRGPHFSGEMGKRAGGERGSLPLDPFSLVGGNLLGSCFFVWWGCRFLIVTPVKSAPTGWARMEWAGTLQ